MSDDTVMNLNTASLQSNTEITPYVITSGSIIANETVEVEKGDIFDGNIVSTGGIVEAEKSTTITNNSVLDGGIINMTGAATASGNIILNGGTINASGATVSSNIFSSGATLSITNSATAIDNSFYSGAIVSVTGDSTLTTNNFYSGASGYVGTDCTAVGDTIHTGATMTADSGVLMGTIVSGGNLTLQGNSYLAYGEIDSGGNLVASSGAIIEDLMVNSGGSATIMAGATIASEIDPTTTTSVTVAAGGTLTLDPNAGGVVDMATGPGTKLIISASDSTTATTTTPTVINGLSGSSESAQLTLAGVTPSEITSITTTTDQVTFTLSNGSSITLNIAGADQINFENTTTDAQGNIVFDVCFLAGTMIEMEHSVFTTVEDIKIGDTVMTYDWKRKRKLPSLVTWIGKKRTYIKPHLSDDLAGYPVRVLKDAIADNIPNKDLLITSEHSLFFENKFIPVRMLINNHSIYYDYSITSYDYYHIETANHSVIFADGMTTESYLDTGNRHVFAPKGNVTNISFTPSKSWEKDASAPLVVSRDQVEPIYRQIEQRAQNMAVPCKKEALQLSNDAAIHVITNNQQEIHNYAVENGCIVFTLPSDTKSVRIMTRVGRPSETIGAFVDDRRYLGVLIGEMKVSQDERSDIITIHHDSHYLNGWDVKESVPCRWTKGNATVPIPVMTNTQSPMKLTLQILSGGPYFINATDVKKKIA